MNFWLFPWGNTAERLSAKDGLGAFDNPVYSFDTNGLLIGSVIQIVVLIAIISISVLKPWGRRASPDKSKDKAATP